MYSHNILIKWSIEIDFGLSLEKIFFLKSNGFSFFRYWFMVLKFGIHSYGGEDARVLSLRKTNKPTKTKEINERSFYGYFS